MSDQLLHSESGRTDAVGLLQQVDHSHKGCKLVMLLLYLPTFPSCIWVWEQPCKVRCSTVNSLIHLTDVTAELASLPL